MADDKKDPGAFVRLHPKDYRLAQRVAKACGMPLSVWMRVRIMSYLEQWLEKERENAK